MNSPAKPEWAKLQEELSNISYLAVKTEPNDFAGVLKLAEYLNLWAGDAKKIFGSWASSLLLQAGQLIKGLRAGRTSQQGLERILRAILEADKNLNREAEKSDLPIPGREVLVFDSEEGPAKDRMDPEGFLRVKSDDLPGFKDFLQEAPSHFSAMEASLLQSGGREKWDILLLYRPIHTLKSLFGYLGFAGLSGLSHQGESLLEPYKKSGGRPTSREVESLLKLLDLYRLQAAKVGEGLSAGRIEICPLPPLFGNKSLSEPPRTLPGPGPRVEGQPPQGEWEGQGDRDAGVIRIETSKMDELMETLEEWMTYQTQAQMRALDWIEASPLKAPLDRMGKLARKLQDQAVSLRMVPIQPLFVRVGRVIRDLSQKTGKPVRLQLEGGETHLDKRLVDELWEPVLHLVRNAVDHGLELPAERKQRGKDEKGGLWIKAWQQEGHFILSIRDDGRGLDLSRIEQKAKALGWVEEGADLEPSEWQEMIFRPGFSTTDKATDVSGRGIGLDLVKRRLQALKGTVETATMPGEGCLFILRIPLTLALLEGLLVRAGKGLYLIPLAQIQKFFLLEQETPGDGGGAFRIHLAEWFGRQRGSGSPVAVQLEGETQPILLLVDEIFGKREVVLKGLNPLLANLRCVNGGAILGDGQVALILDLPSLIRELSRASLGQEYSARPLGRGAA